MYYASNENLEVEECYIGNFILFENIGDCLKFGDCDGLSKYNFYEVEPQENKITVLGNGKYISQSIKIIKELF